MEINVEMKKYPLHSNVKHKKHIIFYRALWFLFILTTKSVKSTHKTKLQTTCYFSTYFLEIQLVANFIYIGCVPVMVEDNIKDLSWKKIRNSDIILTMCLQ